MASCDHCGTKFSNKSEADRFCCRGCEYVAELISEQGFEQFYDLKKGLAVAPVRSRPFEEHDFSWLLPKMAAAEAKAETHGDSARLDLGLEGISCVGCVWLVEKLFTRHPGSLRAAANPSSGQLHLEWVPGKCDLLPFLRELCQFGYVAAPTGAAGGDHERRRLTARMGLCAAFALNTMGFSLPIYLGMPADFEFAGLFKLIAFLSATLSMLVGGGYFMERAWRAVRAGSLHIDLPIALGLISAYIGSIVGWTLGRERLMYFDFVSIFVFLMLSGRYLQTAAVERNRRRLNRQQPVPDAVPSAENPEKTVGREDIEPGLKFQLAPGQALPVCGILSSAESDFSLEWIHGEADPVRFTAGSRLPAGAILLSRSPIVVEASEKWEDSLLAKLTAPCSGDRVSPGLDKLLRYYLSIVLLFGVSALAYWGWKGDWLIGVQAMISVFVVSCPCALGVAIPLADDMAASAMERLGVFVRTATLWPRLQRIRHVIFDKTGTLTLERPVLENPIAVSNLDEPDALALVRLTRGSLHPIARSLLEALGNRGQKLLSEHGDVVIQEFPGLGVSLESDAGKWSLGKIGWDGQAAVMVQAENSGSELRKEGNLRGAFHFSESLRPDASAMLRQLERRGLQLHILSGDHPDKVKRMTKALGIPEGQSFGGLSPEQKASHVQKLDHQDTLYLGDGANDSLAFDAALVTGTPVVDRSLLESKADFYTLGAGLSFLPKLLTAANARSHAVKSAFAFALLYNLTTVGFSMAGKMSPLVAAIIMPLSSIVSIVIVASIFRRKSRNKG
ncbi:MAG: heavy metal translocating P-type ATPase metal-binding domain-containing protein [Gloeobacteraceae cyanobacterium ES-bin-144]|nr:heavy metal translocating P-type ATPase metal-binding domain-containing protein [Verrucomicrobiales bacterium]